MEYFLKTREECRQIVENSETFYVTETVVEGCKVELYDYRLASIKDFTDNEAFELRGLTFVEQTDGTWERNILMNKFFNVNQTVGWMEDDVKDKKIVRVQDKLDGSVISFVKFPNGTVRAKSKMSFTSEQAVMAQKLYDKNENLRMFINEVMSLDKTPIFEIIGISNQIVLEYEKDELILLQIRDNKTGEYENLYSNTI